MTKKRLVIVIAGCFVLISILTVVNFVFNPLGLGPEAQTVLPDRFFKVQVKDQGQLKLLVDGKEAFDAVLNAINYAADSIHVQTYIWKDDRIGKKVTAKLKKAAGRGVKVTVSKDALGTFFELGDILDGRPSPALSSSGLKDQENITVNVDLFASTDHSKYFIVDRKVAVLGGMNIADEYHQDWHDYMVMIQSAKWAQAFSRKVIDEQPWPEQAPFFIAVNNDKTVEIRTAIIEVIDRSRQSIVVEHAYFSTEKVIEALARAAKRGVKVTVILPKEPDTHIYANWVTINKLLQSDGKQNVKIYLFPQMMHAKVMLADGAIAAVGSANLTLRSMLTSKEVMLFVHGKPDHPLVARLRRQLEADLLKSETVDLAFDLDFVSVIKAKIDKHLW